LPELNASARMIFYGVPAGTAIALAAGAGGFEA
jgi:hypothetical protein